jgi:hypothetical protein
MIEEHKLVQETLISTSGETTSIAVIENGEIKEIELKIYDLRGRVHKFVHLDRTHLLMETFAVIGEMVEELKKRGFIGDEEAGE